jgi:hypothetical protein
VKCYNTDKNKSRYSGTSAMKKHFQGMLSHMGNKTLVFLMPITHVGQPSYLNMRHGGTRFHIFVEYHAAAHTVY